MARLRPRSPSADSTGRDIPVSFTGDMLSVPLAPGNISDVNARAAPLGPPVPMHNDNALAGDTLSGPLAPSTSGLLVKADPPGPPVSNPSIKKPRKDKHTPHKRPGAMPSGPLSSGTLDPATQTAPSGAPVSEARPKNMASSTPKTDCGSSERKSSCPARQSDQGRPHRKKKRRYSIQSSLSSDGSTSSSSFSAGERRLRRCSTSTRSMLRQLTATVSALVQRPAADASADVVLPASAVVLDPGQMSEEILFTFSL